MHRMRRYYFQEKNSYKAKKGVKKQANTELSITTELSHLKWKFSQASVVALDFVACQSKKRANIGNICLACLCSPSSRTIYFLVVRPHVTFASLSSPAVMDIRRLRRRSPEKKINYIKIPLRGTNLPKISL